MVANWLPKGMIPSSSHANCLRFLWWKMVVSILKYVFPSKTVCVQETGWCFVSPSKMLYLGISLLFGSEVVFVIHGRTMGRRREEGAFNGGRSKSRLALSVCQYKASKNDTGMMVFCPNFVFWADTPLRLAEKRVEHVSVSKEFDIISDRCVASLW